MSSEHDEQGELWWWIDCLAEIKLDGARTGGLLSIIEITEAPHAEAPLHVHHREDETFYVLEGDVTFDVGDATIHASAGDVAFGPRGVPHRYAVGADGCRMLFVMTPAGFEDMIRAMGTPAPSRTLPEADGAEPDWEHLATVAQAYGCEMLG